MRVLVCGGRNYRNYERVRDTLQNLPIEILIHGGAQGADRLASDFAWNYGIPQKKFPADWDTHGKAAGPIRNQQMLTEGRPDLVVAFSGGRGTADMIRRAKAAGIEVREIAA